MNYVGTCYPLILGVYGHCFPPCACRGIFPRCPPLSIFPCPTCSRHPSFQRMSGPLLHGGVHSQAAAVGKANAVAHAIRLNVRASKALAFSADQSYRKHGLYKTYYLRLWPLPLVCKLKRDTFQERVRLRIHHSLTRHHHSCKVLPLIVTRL